MKNSIYLAMNYWPKEDYWLLPSSVSGISLIG